MWTTFKLVLIAIVTTLTVSQAHAFGSNNGLQGCGPEADVKTKLFENKRGGSGDFEISFGLTWTFGAQAACEANNAYVNDTRAREARADLIEFNNDKAKAESSEIKALKEKIALCKDFTLDTAPQSIKTFCGDLLQ